MSTEILNNQFAINTKQTTVSITESGGLPVIEISNPHASSRICLQGAHVLSWKPSGEDDVIWLSEDATIAPGKSIRGGVPVCWPWFGIHAEQANYPAHGFARTSMWQLVSTEELSSGETQLCLKFDTNAMPQHLQFMWPQHTIVEYIITIGKKLILDLVTHNMDEKAITIGQALHTYFNIHDITQTSVLGLEGKPYLDKPEGFARKQQEGVVTFDGEVDRVYLETPDSLTIDDTRRKIRIKKFGSHSSVVWNPWETVANKMGDLGKEGYKTMVCVESSNAHDDVVTIESAESHQLWVQYEILK